MKYPILERMLEGESFESVFEIGCAGGPFLQELGDIKVGGMDITNGDLMSAKERFPKYAENFLLHNLTETPWPIPDNSYDIVFSVGVLMYIFEPEKVIKECLRICKKKVIFAEFHRDELDEYGGLSKIAAQEKIIGLGLTRNYQKLFDKMGLKVTIKRPEDQHKAIIICQK